ncbi:MAG: hypothetical protein IPK16_01220 [Anaerolineales bacterium]|nr:hypothetical protein [Anaerolineales bacterium]
MARPLIDSPFIFGIHEPGGEHHMLAAGRPGWILFTETLGHDPEDFSGVDYTAYADQGLGIISRLNHGYEPDGTVPHSSQYELFARRVGNFVATSRGCKTWVIGNEMNYAIERPGVKIDWTRHHSLRDGPSEAADPLRRGLAVRFTALPDHSKEIRTTRGAMVSPGEVITPELYARAFKLCREAIHRVRGHEDDLVLIGAVAPWNTQTIYPGNPNGDWVQYFQDLLTLVGPDGCDGFTVHAYTQGSDPGLISSPAKLAAPFQMRHRNSGPIPTSCLRCLRRCGIYPHSSPRWARLNPGLIRMPAGFRRCTPRLKPGTPKLARSRYVLRFSIVGRGWTSGTSPEKRGSRLISRRRSNATIGGVAPSLRPC